VKCRAAGSRSQVQARRRAGAPTRRTVAAENSRQTALDVRRAAIVVAQPHEYHLAPHPVGQREGDVPCDSKRNSSTATAFEATSKRRKGFPSESRVKRGSRVVHGDKELLEKLGRNDPCPCKSRRRFQELLHAERLDGRVRPSLLLSGTDSFLQPRPGGGVTLDQGTPRARHDWAFAAIISPPPAATRMPRPEEPNPHAHVRPIPA
jgi:hypothetical protein